MVLKKRLDYGFNGFRVPFVPRAPRSARRRGISRTVAEDGQACAFELLASLAGKLLQESASSSASSNASEGNHQPAFDKGVVEQERQDEVKPLETDSINPGSSAESILFSEVASQNTSQKSLVQAEADAVLERTSVNNNFECLEKVEPDLKSSVCKLEDTFGHYSGRLAPAPAPQDFRESVNGNMKNEFRQQEAGNLGIGGSTLAKNYSLKDPLELCVSSPALVDSTSNVKSSLLREAIPTKSISRHGNDSKLGFRDDDENFLRFNKLSTKSKAFRPTQQIAHRRIRKLLTSKYWKTAPKLKDCELSRSDMGVKPLYHKRKTCHSFERYQHDSNLKKRKLLDRGSVVTSDGGFSSESVCNSPEKGKDGCNPGSSSELHVSKDSHVKFSIKSFKIPELYIEVPETATVGSLKRTITESVMAILGGGVRVGVLFHGKKVRDDNRTLLQTGISCKENLDNLGFALEPSSLQVSPISVGDPSSQCESSQATRSPRTPVPDLGVSNVLHETSLLTNTGNIVEHYHESISSQTDTIVDYITPDSRAIVAVPTRNAEALAMVPVAQKARRSELVQRRTRRPFSVSEVEALVQAVEELGTGRWRDVKLRAFENADHRTYVDLKDKWKTLVHTARISPQQRRGEPVPQELLDRVLAAHAYWSQHQAKQQAGNLKMIREASVESQNAEAIQPLAMIM
ncbi:hypothetical protein L6164_033007 [Bauhinia variegata]|uniref:Uncharacterized protein n=1 Tax=Bauhinia variegata TaxID=167791 RepID=A0ACB9KRA4_BAUVA|nr:hypothetical protein L6164_033007 [Bauhinia variegata]